MPNESQITKVKEAIVAEFRRQMSAVYFWDAADEELLDGGPIEMNEFVHTEGIEKGRTFELADKFDMDAIAAAAIRALCE